MKSVTDKFICFLLLLLLLLSPDYSRGEGTKQLEPKPYDLKSSCKLMLSKSIYNHRIPFALIDCPADHRLNIRISDYSTEKIYIGFGLAINYYDTVPVYGNVYYQVKDPSGHLVTGHTLKIIPTQPGDSGFIQYRTQANAGPDINNSNPGGYIPLVINPLENGDYYIEFSFDCEEFQFKFFDITVARNSTLLPGRVWSKSWQLSTGSTNSSDKHSDALLYIYTRDSIVSRFDCNQLTGGVWTVYSNEWGCSIYGSWKHRRKSMKGNASLQPQHMIFLNDPDLSVFPSGIIGEMLDTEIIKECDTVVQFGITVSKRGYVTMIIDLPPLNDTESGPEDIEETYLVNTGYTVLDPPWDGRNALGEYMLNGMPVEVTLIFINGLTNIPLYDVEENPSGFKVDNIRPNVSTGETKLRLYWDDSVLPYGSAVPSNIIDGCLYTDNFPFSGCHNWVFEDISMGDNNTVNTWWYLPGQDSIVMTFPLKMKPRRGYISGPSGICKDQTAMFSTVSIANATQYVWSVNGNGFTYSFIGNYPDTTFSLYIPINLQEGYYTVSVRGKNPECGEGAPAEFSFYVYGESPPPITPLSPICTRNIVEFSIPGAYTDLKWTTDKGTITEGDNKNPVSIRWDYPCTDTIRVTAVSPTCGIRNCVLSVIILPVPHVNLSVSGYSKSCPGNPITFTDLSTTTQGVIASRYWDWSDGNSETTLEPEINHAFNELGEYSIRLVTTTDYGCAADTTITVSIIPFPEVAFTYYQNCVEQPILLMDNSSGEALSAWQWDFNDSPVTVSDYDTKVPSAVYHSLGTYPVTLKVWNKYNCSSQITRAVTIYGIPKADFKYSVACQGVNNIFTNNSIEADTTIDKFNWQLYLNNNLESTSFSNPAHILLKDTIDYQLKLLVTDGFGCRDSITKTIDTKAKPSSNFSFIENYNNEPGLLQFENTTPDAVSYQWYFGENDSSTLVNPSIKFETEDNYSLILISKNSFGCIDSLQRWYYYLPGYFIPSAFTPNDDGLNDLFHPVTQRTVLEPYSLTIYDRWGQIVFETRDPSRGWDGKKNGNFCLPGIYSYVIKYPEGSVEGVKPMSRTGSVVLIR